jgi:iron transport multicopper oxidase
MADGYCRAEGVGVVILKRLEDAMKERDPIYAVIKAASTNHSAQASSITHPHAESQARLFEKVLSRGAVLAQEVNYVEMHGTGTPAGDNAEASSVSAVLCVDRKSSNPLHIGAVKANVGHGEAVRELSLDI